MAEGLGGVVQGFYTGQAMQRGAERDRLRQQAEELALQEAQGLAERQAAARGFSRQALGLGSAPVAAEAAQGLGMPQAAPAPVLGAQIPAQGLGGEMAPQQPTNRDRAMAEVFANDPTLGAKIFDSIGATTERQRENAATRAFQIRSAAPEEREAIIQQQAQQLQSEGRDPTHTLQLLDMPPEAQDRALKAIEMASLPAETRLKLTDPRANIDLMLRQQQMGLRARELDLKQQAERRMAGKMSATAEKTLIEAQDATIQAQQNANRFDTLADDFQRVMASQPAGTRATFTESLKNILGTQDAVSEFRRQFNQIRISEGLRNLPPGPATDKDVEMALKGVPRENASPEQVESFLRGAAKAARFEAGYNQFKSDFLSEKGNTRGLNAAWKGGALSPSLNRQVSVAEIYETAQNRGLTPQAVAEKLGIDYGRLVR